LFEVKLKIRMLIISILCSFLLASCVPTGEQVEIESGIPGTLSFSTGESVSFGVVYYDSAYEKTITVRNTGSLPISNLKIALPDTEEKYLFKGGSYPGSGGNCGKSLDSGDSCEMILLFYPREIGTYSSHLTLSYNNGISLQDEALPISGKAADVARLDIYAGPDFLDEPETTYSFPQVMTFEKTTQTFKIKNSGGLTASFASIADMTPSFSFEGGIYPGVGGDCGFSLAPGKECLVVISFEPQTGDSLANALGITYHDGWQDTSASKSMSGQGYENNARLSYLGSLTIAPFDFGPKVVDNSAGYSVVFEFKNSGPQSATNVVVQLDSSDEFSCESGCDLTSLNAFGLANIGINFKPTAARTGSNQTGLLRISYDNNHPLSPQRVTFIINLAGRGIDRAKLVLADATTLDFGVNEINDQTIQYLRFKNEGPGGSEWGAATNLRLAVDSPYTLDLDSSTCDNEDLVLGSGDSCDVVVKFVSATVGTFSKPLQILYDDGVNADQNDATVALQGEAVLLGDLRIWIKKDADSAYVRYGIFTYPLTRNGMESIVDMKIVNEGTGPATLDASGLLMTDAPVPFVLIDDNSCATAGRVYAVDEACLFQVKFSPSDPDPLAEYSYSKDLITGFGNGQEDKSVKVVLQGTLGVPGDVQFRSEEEVEIVAPLDLGQANPGRKKVSIVQIFNPYADPIVLKSWTITGTVAAHTNIIDVPTGIYDSNSCPYPLPDWELEPYQISQNNYCNLYLEFSPDAAQTDGASYTGQLDVQFKNTSSDSNQKLLDLTGETRFVGEVVLVRTWNDAEQLLVPAVNWLSSTGINESKVTYFYVKNEGQLTATEINLSALVAPYSYSTVYACDTLAPGESCPVSIQFAPTTRESSPGDNRWPTDLSISFKDGLNVDAQESAYELKALAVNPAKLEARLSDEILYGTEFTFDPVPKGLSRTLNVVVKNTGELAAKNVSFSVMDVPFEVVSTTCSEEIAASDAGITSQCTAEVKFYPQEVSNYSSVLTISYDSITSPSNFTFLGEGVEPIATFFGWKKVLATSEISNSQVKLEWDKPEIPDGWLVDHYRIYRSKGSPLDTNSINEGQTSVYKVSFSNSMTENNLDQGEIYYYSVRPIILEDGNDVLMKFLGDYSIIKINTPPSQMSLVHRWMANRYICEALGYQVKEPVTGLCLDTTALEAALCGDVNMRWYSDLGLCEITQYTNKEDCEENEFTWQSASCSDPSYTTMTNCMDAGEIWAEPKGYLAADNNYSCTGVGLHDSYDLGRSLFIDRYELSSAGSAPGVTPYSGLNHFAAHELCKGTYATYQASDYAKRSLTKIENVVSAWGTDKNNCNISSGELKASGAMASCISNFGVFDMVGNLGEWTLDRIYNNMGILNSDISSDMPYNSSLKDIRITHGDTLLEEAACFSIPLGMPFSVVNGVCDNGTRKTDEIMLPRSKFITDRYYSTRLGGTSLGSRGVLVGGDYSSSTGAGVFYSDFKRTPGSTTATFGARCGLTVP